jgi:hypothetical protein
MIFEKVRRVLQQNPPHLFCMFQGVRFSAKKNAGGKPFGKGPAPATTFKNCKP